MKFMETAQNATLASHAGFPACDGKGGCGSLHFILLSQVATGPGLVSTSGCQTLLLQEKMGGKKHFPCDRDLPSGQCV